MEQASEQHLQPGKWLAGAALGALAMYMLDPERGAARRAMSGQKLRELRRQGSGVLDNVVHGIGTRASEAGRTIRSAAAEAAAGAQQLAARGAAGAAQAAHQIAHQAEALSTPGASGAAAQGDGAAGALMQPVHQLIDQARGVAASLGSAAGSGGSAGMLAGKRVATLAGAALALYGLFGRRSTLGMAAGLAGLALLASRTGAAGSRSASRSGASLRSMLSSASPARPVVVEKTIRIDASPEQVFDLFANYENFPRYMSNVIEVRDLGERRSHWVVRGPAGTHFQWNAVLTESTRPRRLAWESEPGAEVEQTGSILFEPFRNGTRVTVHMSYRPPAGMVGHALASLLGSDPKKQMEEDLSRMKSLVERGALARHGEPLASGGSFLH